MLVVDDEADIRTLLETTIARNSLGETPNWKKCLAKT
jgi:hypothetical protein